MTGSLAELRYHPHIQHVSLDTTNRYAEINTNTKLAALRATEPPHASQGSRTTPIWRTDETLLNWLASL
jgi:integrase/recombinase XerD